MKPTPSAESQRGAAGTLEVCKEVLSSKQFERAISALYRADDSVVVAGDFETANSVNFYARLPIDVYGGRAAVLEWGLGYADASRRILTRAQLLGRWTGKRRIFVIASDPQVRDLALPGAYTVLRSAGRLLLSNRPAAAARLAP